MSQGEDLDAIHDFFTSALPTAKTPEAIAMANSFLIWYDGLSWYDKSIAGATIDEAKARRDAFNRSNAVTPAEKAQVEDVIAHGMKTSDMEGTTKPKPVVVPQKLPMLASGSKQTVYVKKLQDLLGMKNLAGGYGTYGPLTTTNVKGQQKKSGLKQTGSVDDATWKSLGITMLDQLMTPAPGFVQAPPGPAIVATTFAKPPAKPVVAPKSGMTVALAQAKLAGLGTGMPTWLQWIVGLGLGIAAIVGVKHAQEK